MINVTIKGEINMYKFEDIVKNEEYRQRVIKFFRPPVRLSVSYDKFMSDLDFMRQVNPEKYAQIIEYTEADFNKVANEQGTDEPDFTMEDIIQPIVDEFSEMEQWKEFIEKDYSNTLDGYEGITNTHQFYKKENDGKYFISVDLESANWQSLQHITGVKESYEEMIVKYTDNLIPPVSKTVRTKITSLLNAKKIIDYNKHLLNVNKDEILQVIYKKTNIDLTSKQPFAFYADEFLIEVDKKTHDIFNIKDIDELEKDIYDEVGVKVHLTPFQLRWMNVNKGCIKQYKNDFEFINLSKDIVLILNKLINKVEIKDVDFEGVKLKDETKEDFISRLKIISEQYKED